MSTGVGKNTAHLTEYRAVEALRILISISSFVIDFSFDLGQISMCSSSTFVKQKSKIPFFYPFVHQ